MIITRKRGAGMNKTIWTIRYTLINVTYFVAFCTIHACAALYLLDCGFTNTEVGVLLAVANIVSAIVQPAVASVIDKGGRLTNQKFIIFSVLLIAAGSGILLFVKNKPVIFVVFALIYMIQFAYQPVMTALCFEYRKAGADIAYGIARGLGSASFAITSVFIGSAVARNGVKLLLIVNIVVMLLSAVAVITFRKPKAEIKQEQKSGSNQNNILAFARKYPAFIVYLACTVCFFFAHNMINDFMIQIIRSLGGGETELGYSNFLQAILELPVMAMIGIILKKISAGKLMVISGIAFLIKIVILIFATNMAMMYLSQSFQLFAYAVFIPATAYYVSSTMDEKDQVKGQAFVTSAITVGGVFSNLLSGVILDHAGITTMLTTGSIVCAIGAAVALVAMAKLPHRK